RFLASLSAGAVVALAACQRSGPAPTPAPDPTPEPTAVPPLPLLSVGVTGTNTTLLPIAKGFSSFLGAAVQGYRVEFAEGAASAADITVTPAAPSDAGRELSKLTRVYAPVTHWRLPLHYVERAELTGILNGTLTDWGQLGSPVAGPIKRLDFTPGGTVLPADVTTPIPAFAAVPDYETLVAAFDAHPLAFAIVPLDLIDFRVQTLAIDGLDPLAGRGDLNAYPLREDFWLTWDSNLGSGLRTAVNAFALAQGFWTDLATAPGNPINVTVAGDIIFGRTVHTRMLRYNDFAHPLRLVAPRLKEADLTIADLECSISDRTEKPEDPFTFYFTTNAAAVEGLVLAGIDGMSLANNHSMNFGKIGLEDTLATLKANGIKAFGGGMTIDEARKPGIFEVKGVKFFFLGYDGITAADYGAGPTWPGTCPLDTKLLLEDIAAAKAAGADLVIPFFHWSEEYVAVPSVYMRRVAHQAIDAGAAMVIGSHPHWVQGTEWYKGKPILYSLGNFVFDQDWSIETKQGMFTELVVRDKKVKRIRLVPVQIEDLNQPRILDVVEGLPVLQRVYDASDVIFAQGTV
ncbi:MAG: CapA family protein, partial [Chloroflexia bacterium]